jgi:hypothetical protein
MKLKQPESIADFKHRIALIMRNREGGAHYSIVGAARPDSCVVRGNFKKSVDNANPVGIVRHDQETL